MTSCRERRLPVDTDSYFLHGGRDRLRVTWKTRVRQVYQGGVGNRKIEQIEKTIFTLLSFRDNTAYKHINAVLLAVVSCYTHNAGTASPSIQECLMAGS